MIRSPIRVLYINLSDQTFEIKAHSDLANYFGGVGVGTKLLLEHLSGEGWGGKETADDPFILSTGPFCGLFPACSQTTASFISPLTKSLGESLVGGGLGVRFKKAGVDSIVISGKAKEPQILVVNGSSVEFVPTELWGKGTFASMEILGKRYPDSSVAVIGPAAETGVRFASVLVDRFFHFQRMGFGTLWGRKRLKGLIISGDNQVVPPPDASSFTEIYSEVSSKIADPLPEGLKSGIRRESEKSWMLEAKIGGLPACNFTCSGSGYEVLGRKVFSSSCGVGCEGCPVECCGVVNYEGVKVPVDFSSLTSLGPLLGLADVEEVLSLLRLAVDLGMDPVSLGVGLAFLTEKEGWAFGDVESYRSLILGVAERKEAWARKLSLGLNRVAGEKEKNFAVVFSGLEAFPYFNGYLTAISQILAPASGLLASGAHLLDIFFSEKTASDEEKVQRLLSEEHQGLLLSFLVACPWVRKVYGLSQIFSCAESLNLGWSHEDLETLAAEIYNLRWEIKEKLGFSWEDITIPERVFELESATGYLERERLERMIGLYRNNIGV